MTSSPRGWSYRKLLLFLFIFSNMENNSFFGWIIGIISLIIIAFLVNIFISSKVPAGYEAILVNSYGQQGVQDTPLVTGRVYYNPFTQDLIKYPVFVQTKDYEPFEVTAKDGSKFTVDPTVSYRIDAGATPIIYQKYREAIVTGKQIGRAHV